MATYKPLPDYLYIDNSDIHGQGLFTKAKLKPNHHIGLSHVKTNLKNFDNNLIRTPLGGFINHSDTANGKITEKDNGYVLSTTETVEVGEEITLKYRWYKV